MSLHDAFNIEITENKESELSEKAYSDQGIKIKYRNNH